VLVGWQARYVGKPPGSNIPKYLTSRGFHKSAWLYNYDTAKDFSFGVIVEGVTDVWRVGERAVAIFGKNISSTQARLAKAAWCEGSLGICLDSGEDESMERSHELMGDRVSFRGGVFGVYLANGRDPADCSYDEIWGHISESAMREGVTLAYG
jgi:hypothetical protein